MMTLGQMLDRQQVTVSFVCANRKCLKENNRVRSRVWFAHEEVACRKCGRVYQLNITIKSLPKGATA
jgi:aspartate carbamoyltransferase regulatory subunit